MRMTAAAALAFFTLAASAQGASPVTVRQDQLPEALRAPAALQPAMQFHAIGVQIYDCVQEQGGAWGWKFRNPEATLFDAAGAKAGDHGAGPFWRLNDGSRIVGQSKASSAAPSTDAVTWLLLTVTSHSGAGGMSAMEAVQRVNTVGGVAPSSPACSAETSGQSSRVPYTADYVFLGAAKQK